MIAHFMKRFAPAAALAIAATLPGCAYIDDWDKVDGVPLAELDMSGEAPTAIELSGSDKLVITEGDSLTITLEGDRDAGDALRFDRNGDRLSIARDRSVFDGSGTAIVRMTLPSPSTLSVAGSGTIESATMSGNAQIEIAGSGDISVESMKVDNLSVEIAGSGDVRAAGTATKLSIEIAGSGNVRLTELTADDVSVEIAGTGDVELASDGKVHAEIAGAGDVQVTGSATCTLDKAGSGSLTCTPRAATAAVEPEEADAE